MSPLIDDRFTMPIQAPIPIFFRCSINCPKFLLSNSNFRTNALVVETAISSHLGVTGQGDWWKVHHVHSYTFTTIYPLYHMFQWVLNRQPKVPHCVGFDFKTLILVEAQPRGIGGLKPPPPNIEGKPPLGLPKIWILTTLSKTFMGMSAWWVQISQ